MIRSKRRTVKRILDLTPSHDLPRHECDNRDNTKRTKAYPIKSQPRRRLSIPPIGVPDRSNQSPTASRRIENPHCQRANGATVRLQNPSDLLNIPSTPHPHPLDHTDDMPVYFRYRQTIAYFDQQLFHRGGGPNIPGRAFPQRANIIRGALS